MTHLVYEYMCETNPVSESASRKRNYQVGTTITCCIGHIFSLQPAAILACIDDKSSENPICTKLIPSIIVEIMSH